MIVDKTILVTMSNQGSYYKDLGYSGTKQGNIIEVDVNHLPKNSNKLVKCSCDKCKKIFERSLQLLNKVNEHLCKECSYDVRAETIDYTNTIIASKKRIGKLHPKFNPNKTEFNSYKAKVYSLTRMQPLSLLENFDKPRGRCGVKDAYQLDHKISVKYGFNNGIPPEMISDISNLQFIPWKENRDKWDKHFATV